MCESPPGFENVEVTKKRYPLIDLNYEPVFKPPLPKEGYGDDSCCGRLQKTVDVICKKYNEPDGNFLLKLKFYFRINYFGGAWSFDWSYS